VTTENQSQSLAAMLDVVRQMERLIDTADEVSLELCEEHFAAIKQVDQKVDRLLSFMDLCKMNAASLEARAKELSDMAERWERKLAGLEKYAFWLCKAYPDMAWRGTDRAFRVQTNPPKLICNFTKKSTISNVVDPDFLNEVPDEYLEERTVKVLRTDVLKDDLKKGATASFARLEREEVLKVDPKLSVRGQK
jgi:hypothetical protein